MLYLGIDRHKRQLTVNLRGEDGSVKEVRGGVRSSSSSSSGDTLPNSCFFLCVVCGVVLVWGRVSAVSRPDRRHAPNDPKTPHCPAADRSARVRAEPVARPRTSHFSRRLY